MHTHPAQFDLSSDGLYLNRWLTYSGYIDNWSHPDDDQTSRYTSAFAGTKNEARLRRPRPKKYAMDYTFNHQAEINDRFIPARLSPHNVNVYNTSVFQADAQIRLLRLRPRLHGSRIRCDLLSYSFPPSVSYEALSYCWGANDKRETISVNEFDDFEVTDNLAAALGRLRLPRETRTLWVDAICINQDDIEEKNAQVRLMGEIYGAARRTLLWLGDGVKQKSASTIGSARSPVLRILACISTFLLWLANFLLGRSLSGTPESHNADDMQDLRNALIHTVPSWWERLWTVQEVVRSRDLPDVCFGTWQLRWHDFKSLVKPFARSGEILSSNVQGRTRHIDPSVPEFKALKLQTRLDELEELHSTYSTRRTASLLQLSHLNERAMVTDPRDRVYSLLGLVRLREAEMNEIDYSRSISAQQVFAKATYNIINLNKNLNVLEYVSASSSHDPVMPTWAFDFATKTISWVNIAGSRLDTEFQQNMKSKEIGEVHLSADARLLTVSGYFIDYIHAVYPLGREQDSPLFKAYGSNWSEEVGRRPDGSQYWIGSSSGSVNFIWEFSPLFLRPMSATSLGYGNRKEFCSTTDGVLDHIFDNWLRYSAGLVMRSVGGIDPVGAYWWNHLRRGRVRGHDCVGVHPSFYVTGSGYIGVGPPGTQQGDEVVLLLGAPSASL